MLLKHEELITKYFEHQMTPGEEQNFLISLAASDEMRIAFRSHLELIRTVHEDKDDMRSIARVRNQTFAAIGLSAASVSPFLEQGLVNNQKKIETPVSANVAKPSFVRSRLQFFGTPKVSLVSGVLVGFLGAAALFNLPSSTNSHKTGSVAPSQRPSMTHTEPFGSPNTTVLGEQPRSQEPISSHSEPLSSNETIGDRKALNRVSATGKKLDFPAGKTRTVSSAKSHSNGASDAKLQMLDKTLPGQLTSSGAKIVHPNKNAQSIDSAKAK